MMAENGLSFTLSHSSLAFLFLFLFCLFFRFLPVAVDLKDAYVARVEQLASSAGWQAASPARVAWSPDAAHSWTDERDFEAHTDEEDKRQALTQPVRLNFIAPAIASADKRAK